MSSPRSSNLSQYNLRTLFAAVALLAGVFASGRYGGGVGLMAAATVAAVDRWPSRQALIVADDHPVTWRDLLGYVCALANSQPPQPGGRSLMPSFRVRNARAKELLSWVPAYADYRAGLAR